MKRIITMVIVVFLVLQSVCLAEQREIKFRNLEWGCSVKEAEKALKKEGIDNIYVFDTNTWLPWIKNIKDNNFVGPENCGSIAWGTAPNVAGYKNVRFSLSFMNGISEDMLLDKEATRLYLAVYTFQAVDRKSVYEDLRSKLTSQYGQGLYETGESSIWTEKDGLRTLPDHLMGWQGENNTALLLIYEAARDQNDEGEISLIYYKSNADTELENVLEAAKRTEALEEEKNRDKSNTSGL